MIEEAQGRSRHPWQRWSSARRQEAARSIHHYLAPPPRPQPSITPFSTAASTRPQGPWGMVSPPPGLHAAPPATRPPAPPSGPGTATQGMSPAAFEPWAVSVEDYGIICGWSPPLAASYVRLLCDGALQQRIDTLRQAGLQAAPYYCSDTCGEKRCGRAEVRGRDMVRSLRTLRSPGIVSTRT